ncbi:MAG: TonB-dependent receptor [Pyrinomonadaceae bacterium]
MPVTETVLNASGVVSTTTLGSLSLGNFISPLDLVAAGAPTGYFQSLVLPGRDAQIDLRNYQLNFFAQDDWRARPNLLISYGLRYEYNTPPKEADRKIENTFQAVLAPQVAGFSDFIGGRSKIFDPDRNNFAPRIGIAYSPSPSTVIRGGYGIYYDQIIGAVVSQSRNVYPTFTTVNFGGGLPCYLFRISDAFCPVTIPQTNNGFIFNLLTPPNNPQAPSVAAGTLNTSSIGTSSGVPLSILSTLFPLNQSGSPFAVRSGSPFGATLPTRQLDTPMSHQYFAGVEQQLGRSNTFLSVAYVGTTGRNLLRFTTPNLGSNYILRVNEISLLTFQAGLPNAPQYFSSVPTLRGFTYDPSTSLASTLAGNGRPSNAGIRDNNVGPITQFETTARSQYHSLQIQLRGRFSREFQYQVNYTLGTAKDDVSDVFDLAGASALPQDSLSFAGEYAPSNFDVRNKIAYSLVYDLPGLKDEGIFVRGFLGGWQIASSGRFHTGQPFTVNSIFDVNLDGNLTDRLNNTSLISENAGNNAQVLTNSGTSTAQLQSMLAAVGTDGSVPRNSFRGRSLLNLDLALSKRFFVTEKQNLQFRIEIFNFINRANFAIPVRFLEAPSFGRAVDTVTPGRRIQFALKYLF